MFEANENWSYLGCLSWYYGLFAVVLYGIVYLLEVKLDLPLWDHECPGLAHINLKRLVQNIINEVSKLPEILDKSNTKIDRSEIFLPYFEPKKYNELLATAVLNKIVESYHNPKNLPYPENSSGIQSGASDLDSNHNETFVKSVKKGFHSLSERRLFDQENCNSSGGDSLTEITASMTNDDNHEIVSAIDSPPTYSSSISDNDGNDLENFLQKHKDKLQLPDLSGQADSNDDDLQSLNSNGTDGTWEDNWLFKSRKFKNDTKTNAIAMLVPSPTQEVKALIGDKNADEVSDLSEAEDGSNDEQNDDDISSDDDDNQLHSDDIPNVLIQNKTIIGGKHNLIELFEPPTDFESLTSLTSLPEAKNNTLLISQKINNNNIIENKNYMELNNIEIIKMDETSNHFIEKKQEFMDEKISVYEENIHESNRELDFMENLDIKIEIEKRPIPAPRKSSKPEISIVYDSKEIEENILIDSGIENTEIESLNHDFNSECDENEFKSCIDLDNQLVEQQTSRPILSLELLTEALNSPKNSLKTPTVANTITPANTPTTPDLIHRIETTPKVEGHIHTPISDLEPHYSLDLLLGVVHEHLNTIKETENAIEIETVEPSSDLIFKFDSVAPIEENNTLFFDNDSLMNETVVDDMISLDSLNIEIKTDETRRIEMRTLVKEDNQIVQSLIVTNEIDIPQEIIIGETPHFRTFEHSISTTEETTEDSLENLQSINQEIASSNKSIEEIFNDLPVSDFIDVQNIEFKNIELDDNFNRENLAKEITLETEIIENLKEPRELNKIHVKHDLITGINQSEEFIISNPAPNESKQFAIKTCTIDRENLAKEIALETEIIENLKEPRELNKIHVKHDLITEMNPSEEFIISNPAPNESKQFAIKTCTIDRENLAKEITLETEIIENLKEPRELNKIHVKHDLITGINQGEEFIISNPAPNESKQFAIKTCTIDRDNLAKEIALETEIIENLKEPRELNKIHVKHDLITGMNQGEEFIISNPAPNESKQFSIKTCTIDRDNLAKEIALETEIIENLKEPRELYKIHAKHDLITEMNENEELIISNLAPTESKQFAIKTCTIDQENLAKEITLETEIIENLKEPRELNKIHAKHDLITEINQSEEFIISNPVSNESKQFAIKTCTISELDQSQVEHAKERIAKINIIENFNVEKCIENESKETVKLYLKTDLEPEACIEEIFVTNPSPNQLKTYAMQSVIFNESAFEIENPIEVRFNEPSSSQKTITLQEEIISLQSPEINYTEHPRYQSPLFRNVLRKSPPPVIKISELTNNKNETNQIIITNTKPLNTNDSYLKSYQILSEINKTLNGALEKEQELNLDETDKEHMIPGSIAEREHLKWQNAAPIANNPYSAELLQKRLTDQNTKTTIDLNQTLKIEENETTTTSSATTSPATSPTKDQEKKLIDIFKAEQTNFKRFGRDYYINDAKRSSGIRPRYSQLSQDEDEQSSTYILENKEQIKSESEIKIQQTKEFLKNEIYPIQKSSSFGDTNKINKENIFAARPIFVEEHNPILLKATKIKTLSTESRDLYLLPVDTETQQISISLTSSERSLVSPTTLETSSLSDDSDSTRIYDLKTLQTKIIKEEIIQNQIINHQQNNNINNNNNIQIKMNDEKIIKSSKPLPPALSPKPLSSDTFKFFTPPRKTSLPANKIVTQVSVDIKPENETTTAVNNISNGNGFQDGDGNHMPIEDDVKAALPSVKKLAMNFNQSHEQKPLGPIIKPKTLIWQNSNENISITEHSAPNDIPKPIKPNVVELSRDTSTPEVSIITQSNRKIYPMAPGYSISGRSISKQIRNELKEATYNEEIKNNEPKDDSIYSSPPRSPSPVLVPGKLKSSIAFFENLKQK